MALYSDINTSKNQRFPKVYDIDSVWQSFSNFMKTRKRQRFFRPPLGSELNKDLLFELMYEEAVFYAVTTMTRELNFWDPRIQVDRNRTTVDLDYDNGIVKIKLVFTIKGFEDKTITKELEF